MAGFGETYKEKRGKIDDLVVALNGASCTINATKAQADEATKKGISVCKVSQEGNLKDYIQKSKDGTEKNEYEVKASEESKENINENASGEKER